jgi:hypothetical protein
MRPRVVLVTCLAALLATTMVAVPSARAKLSALGTRTTAAVAQVPSSPPPTAQLAMQAAPPLPMLRATSASDVRAPGGTSFFGWAFLDRKTGNVTGSTNSASGTNSTESMVKAWIASDYLRQQASSGNQPSDTVLNDLTLMIIDSNDNTAEKYYEQDGGDAVIQRMISMCGLANTSVVPGWWAKTQMSPKDAVKYGLCVANGTAAGQKWTDWILSTMKNVRGGVNDQVSVAKQGGRWGIIDALPTSLAQNTSIKNGWTLYSDGWHVSCLAVNPDWILNVMVRTGGGLQSAAGDCRAVAKQLLYTPDV